MESLPTLYFIHVVWFCVNKCMSNCCFNFVFSSDMNLDPNGYIDNDWQWVGPGETGSTKLNKIQEEYEGQGITKYMGVTFDGSTPDEQMGLAGQAIAAAITTMTPFHLGLLFCSDPGLVFTSQSM